MCASHIGGLATRGSQRRPTGSVGVELSGLREENRSLYGVIKLVSSSLELAPMLQGVVDLATDATGCHACFIYLLEDGKLTIRAASPVFDEAVGNVQFSVQEGLTGWVARHRAPAFIREQAMNDPRMKYVPLLREEDFQSMAAVPILSRAGRDDRGHRPAHQGPARVRRGHAQAARPHRLARLGRDRERPAL